MIIDTQEWNGIKRSMDAREVSEEADRDKQRTKRAILESRRVLETIRKSTQECDRQVAQSRKDLGHHNPPSKGRPA